MGLCRRLMTVSQALGNLLLYGVGNVLTLFSFIMQTGT